MPTVARDQLATAVVLLEYLDQVGLGPRADHGDVADALDDVAVSCSPHRDLAVNPAKMLAIALADTNPVVWGGSSLAARAARRVAETIRRASGQSAIAGDAEHLLPLIEAARPRDVFDDPFADGEDDVRPMLLVFDDGTVDPVVREDHERLRVAAAEHGVRVEQLLSRPRRTRRSPATPPRAQREGRRRVPPPRPGQRLSRPGATGSLPRMSTEGSTRAVVAALLANTGIAVTKFLAFLLTGASSMLAEAIHSVADSGNQALLLLGGRQARKRPTAAHPFGYGRERYIYAFIVSIVLFSVGGLFALYEAYHKGHEALHATLRTSPTTRSSSTVAGGGCRSSCSWRPS